MVATSIHDRDRSQPASVVILGATGPIGRHLALRLASDGIPVTATSRSGERLKSAFDETPVVTVVADILDQQRTQQLVGEHEVVVLAAGVEPGQLESQIAMARVVAGSAPSRVIYVSSCWSYSPIVEGVVDESHPRNGSTNAARARKLAEDVLFEIGATITHLPDFYGPLVHTSPVQRVLRLALDDRRVTWPAHDDTPRDYGFVRDLVVDIEEVLRVGALEGVHLILPGSGPLTLAAIRSTLEEELGRKVKTTSLGAVPLGLVRLIDPWTRHLGSAASEYRRPVTYDTRRFTDLVGAPSRTPHGDALRITLRWLRNHER